MPKIIENFIDKRQNYGKKGNNLKVLMDLFKDRDDIKIPETLILPNSIFKQIVAENGSVDFSDYNNIYINPTLEQEIIKAIHRKFGNSKLVIRSSATCEDSIFFSGAGQYDSFLNVEDDGKIIVAVKKIYASLFNKNSQLYSKIYDINLKKESMAVLIQSVAPVVKAGVMFSCDPVNQDKKYIIESTKGLGTNVVEGRGSINYLEIDYSHKNKIIDFEIELLITAIDVIKNRFDCDVDVEWGITEDGTLYIFQVRPIIYRNVNFKINYDSAIPFYKCTPISRGFTIGKVENITNRNCGEVLFQNEKYDFNNMELLLSCKGVILKDRSKLSHFANILRELVKPCVYADDFQFKQNTLYIIDAFDGKIIDTDRLDEKAKIKFLFDNFKYMKCVLDNSLERFNGILKIEEDNKYEEVVFNINKDKLIHSLINNGFKKKIINQKIYTYDFQDNSLIANNVIFRIQISNKKINVQFKSLKMDNDTFRQEEGILIDFDNLKNAKKFMESYLLQETGYQERKITKYERDDIVVNIIQWPGCEPYVGVESKKLSQLAHINKELDLENCLITGWGGKQIFDKLNLTIDNCKFNEEENDEK